MRRIHEIQNKLVEVKRTSVYNVSYSRQLEIVLNNPKLNKLETFYELEVKLNGNSNESLQGQRDALAWVLNVD